MKSKPIVFILISIIFVFILSSCKLADTFTQIVIAPTYTPYPTLTQYPTYTPYPAPKLRPTTRAAVTEAPATEAPSELFFTPGLDMGNPNAAVVVIEFADFQCPYCSNYFLTLEPTIIRDYVDTNKIHYIYSPMAFLGKESNDAAEAAYCANDQGKFWEYRSQLYNNLTGENNGSYSMENLTKFAVNIGLSQIDFIQCMSSDKHLTDLASAEAFASSRGVNSTPTFIVNDEVISSSELVNTIEEALSKQ